VVDRLVTIWAYPDEKVFLARLPTLAGGSIVICMSRIGLKRFSISPRGTNLALWVLFACLCVLAQMMGTPVTLIGLLTSDISVESVSEDFSIAPITPELGPASPPRLHEKSEPLLHLPIIVTSVFHPPQA